MWATAVWRGAWRSSTADLRAGPPSTDRAGARSGIATPPERRSADVPARWFDLIQPIDCSERATILSTTCVVMPCVPRGRAGMSVELPPLGRCHRCKAASRRDWCQRINIRNCERDTSKLGWQLPRPMSGCRCRANARPLRWSASHRSLRHRALLRSHRLCLRQCARVWHVQSQHAQGQRCRRRWATCCESTT